MKKGLAECSKTFSHITNDKRLTDLILIKINDRFFNLRCFENQLWLVVDDELASDKSIFIYLSW